MIRYGQHWPCGTYMREATFCNYCWNLDLPLYKFWIWANDAYYLMDDYWVHFDRQVTEYIRTHTVLELM